jgi:hypothetical protein
VSLLEPELVFLRRPNFCPRNLSLSHRISAIWQLIGLCPFFDDFMCILTWDDLIEQHVDLLGKLPPESWHRWDARSKSFDEEGVRIQEIVEGALMGTIEQRFEENVQESRRFQRMEEVSEEEKVALIDRHAKGHVGV